MSVENFKKEDLVGKSLERLLAEIESLSREGTEESYQKLENFIKELAKVSSDATLVVSKKDGSQWMGIRDQDVDLIETLRDITEEVKKGIDGNSASAEEHKARESLRRTISSTIGVLLKEDEIMQELAERGMTNEEFIKNAEEEITRSKAKVDTLKPLQAESKEIMELFGKTVYSESSKSYFSKSKLDELKHDKQALELLSEVEKKLQELKRLQDGAKTMDPSSTDYANNKKTMEVLLGDVKGLAGDLKSLGLRTSDVGTASDRKTQAIDFSYLERLDITSDFEDAGNHTTGIMRDDTPPYKSIQTLINDDYENIRKVMRDNYARFGFADEAAVDALTQEEIDAKVAEKKNELDRINEEIKFEEEYQAQTEASMGKFRTKADRETELSKKFKTVRRIEPVMVEKKVQKKDKDGKPVLDKDGNPVMEVEKDKDGKPIMVEKKVQKKDKDGKPVFDKDGKPVMVVETKEITEYIPTDDARRDYLAAAGIADEAQYKQQKLDAAKAEQESLEAALTPDQKRQLIRASYQKDGRVHPLKWLRSQFAPSGMWDKQYKHQYLSDKITTAQADASKKADQELTSKISSTVKRDLQDRDALRAEIGIVRDSYKKSIISAVSQEKMTDELYRGQSDSHVRAGARRAAMNTSLDVVSDAEMLIALQREARGEITKAELEAIQREYSAQSAARVMTDKRAIQDRAHADDVLNPTKSRKPETPTYRDEEVR